MSSNQISIKEIFQKNKPEIVFLVIGLALGVYLNWETAAIIFFLVLIHVILHPISSRIFSALGVLSLVIMAFMLFWERESRAEEFAIYSFYFLFLAILMAIFEIRKDKSKV